MLETVDFPLATPPSIQRSAFHDGLLNVEVLNIEGIFLDKPASLLHFVTHQNAEGLGRPRQRPLPLPSEGSGVSGFIVVSRAVRVHFTQPLIPLDIQSFLADLIEEME